MISDPLLKGRVEKAFMTLQALPTSERARPMGPKSAWPEMMRQAKRGAILHRGPMQFAPNSLDITDCYLIIDMLYELSDMQRILISARAMNVSWQSLQIRFNRSRTHLNRLYQRALQALSVQLNEQNRKRELTKGT